MINSDSSGQNRRGFLKSAAFTAGGLSLGLPALANAFPAEAASKLVEEIKEATGGRSVSLFSKPLQFLSVPDMAIALKKMGFDGIDLTIRKDGHVTPENAARDLPAAVSAIRKAGLEVFTVVTEIGEYSKLNEEIIRTLAQLGIKQYRMAFLNVDTQNGILSSLDKIKTRFNELALLNKKYKVQGTYQNHSGLRLGGSVWDIWYVLKDIDPEWIGVQYDPMHACIEGQKSWVYNFDLIKNRILSINVKDFHWDKMDGKWRVKLVPLGEGMVDIKQFFGLVKKENLNVPVSLHLEHEMGGAEEGHKNITIAKSQVLDYVRKDLTTLNSMLKTAGLN